jgi:hypothetical protein
VAMPVLVGVGTRSIVRMSMRGSRRLLGLVHGPIVGRVNGRRIISGTFEPRDPRRALPSGAA